MGQIQTTLLWQDIEIEITYKPSWVTGSSDVSHLEVCSINPERARLPITEAGYRSHFFRSADIFSIEEITEYVENWLNECAKKAEWKAYQSKQQNQQLSLF